MKSSLVVGIPKEIKPFEKRVGLAPSAVKKLAGAGIRVLVEQNAGLSSSFPDAEYRSAGAEIVPHAKALYEGAGLIQKVKEPLEPEFALLRKQILFCFLHLASPENLKLREVLLKSGCTAIGFETVEKEGCLPILAPMSRIAGALAAAYGAYFQSLSLSLQKRGKGERGIQYPPGFHEGLSRIAGFYPDFSGKISIGKTIIYGGGVAGASALTAVLQMKGEPVVVEMNEDRRRFLKKMTPQVFSPQEVPEAVLENAEIVIGTVHSRGQRARLIFDDDVLLKISRLKKKIILDVAIDQGGNFPEARSTNYLDPLCLDSAGNLRFAVPNIPSFCGRAASEALSEVTCPYTEALALDPGEAFQSFPELARGVNVHNGQMKISVV